MSLLRLAQVMLIEESVALIVRAILWVLLIVAPGGILLLPLLVGDAAMRRRKRESQPPAVDAPQPAEKSPLPTPVQAR